MRGVEWLAYNGCLERAKSAYSLAGAIIHNAMWFSRYAGPDSATHGLQLTIVHGVALVYCLRVLEAGRLRPRGGQDRVLLRPLSSRFLSVSSCGLFSLVPFRGLSLPPEVMTDLGAMTHPTGLTLT